MVESTDVPRWFGILRKPDGTLIFASKSVAAIPEQLSFVKKILRYEESDSILELFCNGKLEPKHFREYAEDTYAPRLRKKS